MDLDLAKVGANGRVLFGDLLKDVELVNIEQNADGSFTVEPVRIRPSVARGTDSPQGGDLNQ